MSEIRRVNRPVFRLSKPGKDVHWSTRENPYHEALKTKKMMASPLPRELPFKKETGSAFTDEERQAFGGSLPYPEESPQTPEEESRDDLSGDGYQSWTYNPNNLASFPDSVLNSIAVDAATDTEFENLDDEYDKRPHLKRPWRKE